MYHILLSSSSADRHLDYLHLSAILNNTAMSSLRFCVGMFSILGGRQLEVESLTGMVTLSVVLAKLFCKVAATFLLRVLEIFWN